MNDGGTLQLSKQLTENPNRTLTTLLIVTCEINTATLTTLARFGGVTDYYVDYFLNHLCNRCSASVYFFIDLFKVCGRTADAW